MIDGRRQDPAALRLAAEIAQRYRQPYPGSEGEVRGLLLALTFVLGEPCNLPVAEAFVRELAEPRELGRAYTAAWTETGTFPGRCIAAESSVLLPWAWARAWLADVLERNLDRWPRGDVGVRAAYHAVLADIRGEAEPLVHRGVTWTLPFHELSVTRE